MSFIPSTPNESNNYKAAIKLALARTNNDWFVITKDHLGRKTPYNAQGAFQGFTKLIKAGNLKLEVAKGEDTDTDTKVVALRKVS
jgi:hypothetical protein